MKEFVITHPDGTKLNLISAVENRAVTAAVQNMALLGEDTVELTISSAEPINFYIGDTIKCNGRTYTINMLPSAKKSGGRKYTYTAEFEGPQYQLINTVFLLPEDTQKDSLTGTLNDFANVLLSNITRLYSGWAISVEQETGKEDEYKTLTYTDQNSLQVLQDLCTQFEVEFFISEEDDGTKKIKLKPTVGVSFPYKFAYGQGGGVYELTRNKQENTDLITRLYCFGSSTNIPTNYGYDRLCLPYAGTGNKKNASYIQDTAQIATYGVHEGVFTDDSIFPEYEGTVTSVGDNEKTFTDANFPFDLGAVDDEGNTKYLQNGVNAKITFQTGNLAGYEFEIDKDAYKYTEGEGLKVVLISYTDNIGLTLPMPSSESEGAAAYQFKKGDKYIISDIYMPEAFITEAEEKLKKKGNEYLQQYKAPQVSYSLNIDSAFLEKTAGETIGVKNLFEVGDTLQVSDSTIGSESGLRITAFERDLLQPYKYTFTLGDKVTASTLVRIVQKINKATEVIKNNNLDDTARQVRNWRTTQEVINAVFDEEGEYYTEKIKPLSIETKLLSVGARYQQLALKGVTFYPNYGGDPSVFKATAGQLTHYTINDDGTARNWDLNSADYSELVSTSMYYIYTRVYKENTWGDTILDTEAHSVEEGDYYYFLIGYLSSVIEGARQITQAYGQTMINGRFVNTGRIQSQDTKTYFDLDSGEIHGNIHFTGTDGTEKSGADLYDKTTELNEYINNTIMPDLQDLQEQIDGKIEQYFYTYNPTTNNEPASGWTTDAEKANHLGDIFYNTSTGKGWRWVKDGAVVYGWSQLSDTDTAAALEAAQTALTEARERQRIFTEEPVPPYSVGDLYIDSEGAISKCVTERLEGVYVSTDWSPYTSLSTAAAVETLRNETNTTIAALQADLDGKIETWYQQSDPSINWKESGDWLKHTGDIWIKPTNGETYRLTRHANGGYQWELINEPAIANEAWDRSEENAEEIQKKTQTFVIQPYPPYNVGDFWLTGDGDDGELLRCVTARDETEAFYESDWTEATYYDNTQTTIDGGVVTAGSLQIVGTNSQAVVAGMTGADSGDENTDADDIRIWAGSDKRTRDKAPFRVDQAGNLYASQADIEGTIKAKAGEIGGFEIGEDHIGKEDDLTAITGDGLSLYADFIKFASNYRGAVIGTQSDIKPFTGYPALGLLYDSTPALYGTNYGLCVEISGAAHNIAIAAKGDINTKGTVNDYDYTTLKWSRSDYSYSTLWTNPASRYDLLGWVKKLLIIETTAYSNWYHYLSLPSAESVCRSLGIEEKTDFNLDGHITVYSTTSQFMKLCLLTANKTTSYETLATIVNRDNTTANYYVAENSTINYRLIYSGGRYLCFIL